MYIAASPNADYTIVIKQLFIDLIHALNPSYKLPCIRMIHLGIAEIAAEIRNRVAELIIAAARVNLGLDLWTAADGDHYLGVVAHFYCKQIKAPIRVVVGCRQLVLHATASNIAELVSPAKRAAVEIRGALRRRFIDCFHIGDSRLSKLYAAAI